MDYYRLLQDERYTDYEAPAGIGKIVDRRTLNSLEGRQQLENIVLQFYTEGGNEYIDFIQRPVPLISDSLKTILSKYQKGIFYKLAVLADTQKMVQSLYWLFVPETVACMSEESEWNKNETLKKIVLDRSRVGPYKIFKIADPLEDYLIVDLDVAESILKYKCKGIILKKIETQA